MQEIKIVGGISDLKALLIRTFQIERDPDTVKLFFSVEDKLVFMHDYQHHINRILIAKDNATIDVTPDLLTDRSKDLVQLALEQPDPAKYLNEKFLLCGKFRP